MTYYDVKMQHTEKTFEALAHMQYDLFCRSNRIIRTIMGVAAVLLGLTNGDSWWAILLIAYGCYLFTSKYSSANHTAHKLADQIKETGMPFPASQYLFHGDRMEIISLPKEERLEEPLRYSDVCRLGEDYQYFYLFRDQYGGYMIPKEALGKKALDFQDFIQEKTGLTVRNKFAPVIRVLQRAGRTKK